MGQEISLEGTGKFSVKTANGVFTGLTFTDPASGKALCHRFAGVPYALPNDVRWTRSKPVPDDFDYSGAEYVDFGPISTQPQIEGPLEYMNSDSPTTDDCTHLNIWVPASVDFAAAAKLPVLFFIHGGWLQYGSACQSPTYDPRFLQSVFDQKFVIVSPAYRLSSVGFLSSAHLHSTEGSNFGFWDQRLALEWTSRFVGLFGGDADKITVAGLSAGSYSTFFQLAYEVYHPEEPQLIKQVALFSNCLIVQPKTLAEVESQFEEYLELLGVPSEISDAAKIDALREIDSAVLMETVLKMKMHTFRAVTDDDFVSSALLRDMHSGAYGKKLFEKKVRILIGEVDNEPVIYSVLNTPKTVDELPLQVENYYPKKVVAPLMELYDVPADLDQDGLRKVFGQILADSQVYATTRTFLHNSLKLAPAFFSSIFRYRISFSPGYIRAELEKRGIFGVLHGGDQNIWYYSSVDLLTEDERALYREFLKPYLDFIQLDDVHWGTDKISQYRFLSADGEISVQDDALWEKELAKGERIYAAQL